MEKQIMMVCITGMALFLATAAFAQVTADDVNCTSPCISSTEIVDSAVSSADISSNAVTATKIQNNAVTGPKIQNNAVTAAKIFDGTIANADISSTAAIDATKISGTAWTSTNDGPSTGLDADTLDGIEASQLLQNGQDGTIGSLTMSAGNITSASGGDICIGNCSTE